jgi:hypothetical protein
MEENCKSHGILWFWCFVRKITDRRALSYFPYEYNDWLFAFGVPDGYEDKASKWYCDYRELHEHILVSKYGSANKVKMIKEEQDYQEKKKHWHFHESSWYMRGAN